jgi:hypothetical protein
MGTVSSSAEEGKQPDDETWGDVKSEETKSRGRKQRETDEEPGGDARIS